MSLSPRATEQLVLQQRKYFVSLPDKRDRILAAWQGIQAEGWSGDDLRRLKTEVHRLSGSAGSYGLPALGRAASDLDRVLSSDLDMSILVASLAELMDSLLHALDQAILNQQTVSATR